VSRSGFELAEKSEVPPLGPCRFNLDMNLNMLVGSSVRRRFHRHDRSSVSKRRRNCLITSVLRPNERTGRQDEPQANPLSYMALEPFGPCFLILYTVCRTSWAGDQPVARPLPAHRHPCRKWDSNPVFQQAKTVHSSECAAAVIGQANTGPNVIS
jgi:hypothetical protein